MFAGGVVIYGGPGSALTGVGALLATAAALGATILGFLWFPLKRLAEAIRIEEEEGEGDSEEGKGRRT